MQPKSCNPSHATQVKQTKVMQSKLWKRKLRVMLTKWKVKNDGVQRFRSSCQRKSFGLGCHFFCIFSRMLVTVRVAWLMASAAFTRSCRACAIVHKLLCSWACLSPLLYVTKQMSHFSKSWAAWRCFSAYFISASKSKSHSAGACSACTSSGEDWPGLPFMCSWKRAW